LKTAKLFGYEGSEKFVTHDEAMVDAMRLEIASWYEQIIRRPDWADVEEHDGHYQLYPSQHEALIRQTKVDKLPTHFPINRETRNMLVVCGFKPASLMTGYDWPGVGPDQQALVPRQVQVVSASYLTKHRMSWNTNGMRSGKTLAAIWGFDRLRKTGSIKRVLIIAPLSIVNEAWGASIRSVDPFADLVIFNSGNQQARKQIADNPDTIVMNPAKTRYLAEELIKCAPDLIVVDEATVFKNFEQSGGKPVQQTVKVREIIQRSGAMLWALTATPITKLATDLWPLGSLINKDFPGYFMWRNQTTTPIPNKSGGYFPQPDSVVIPLARKYMSPVLGYPTAACIDLPEQDYIGSEATLTPQQEKAIEDLSDDKKKSTVIDGRWIDAWGRSKKQKLLQILAGSVRVTNKGDDPDNFAEIDCHDRIRLLTEMVQEEKANSSKKVLIFCAFVGGQYTMQEHLKKNKVHALVLNGRVTAGAKRDALLHQFRTDEKIDALIVHPEIGKFGLDLSICDVSIWFIPPMSVDQWLQSNARGQAARSEDKQRTCIRYIYGPAWEKELYMRMAKMQTTAILATSPQDRSILEQPNE